MKVLTILILERAPVQLFIIGRNSHSGAWNFIIADKCLGPKVVNLQYDIL